MCFPSNGLSLPLNSSVPMEARVYIAEGCLRCILSVLSKLINADLQSNRSIFGKKVATVLSVGAARGQRGPL